MLVTACLVVACGPPSKLTGDLHDDYRYVLMNPSVYPGRDADCGFGIACEDTPDEVVALALVEWRIAQAKKQKELGEPELCREEAEVGWMVGRGLVKWTRRHVELHAKSEREEHKRPRGQSYTYTELLEKARTLSDEAKSVHVACGGKKLTTNQFGETAAFVSSGTSIKFDETWPLDEDHDASAIDSLDVTPTLGKIGPCFSRPDTLRIVARLGDGKVLDSEAKGAAMLDKGTLAISIDAGSVDAAGRVTAPASGIEALDVPVAVTVSLVRDPKMKVTKSMKWDLGCPIAMERRGRTGSTGAPGADGSPGRPGGRGGNGGPGGPGPNLDVDVYVKTTAKGAKVGIVDVRDHGLAYFSLDGPGVDVFSIGGAGGPAGRGGTGGEGGPGDGCHRGGAGAPGGPGGNAGPGGDGGTIVVRFDKTHPELARLVRTESRGAGAQAGGTGGAGGKGGVPPPRNGCARRAGEHGAGGPNGSAGAPGKPGPKPKYEAVEAKRLRGG